MSPSGSELNSLDYYLLISLIFVFGTLVEVALILIMKQGQYILMIRTGLFGTALDNSSNSTINEYETIPNVNGITPIDTNFPELGIAKQGMKISVIGDKWRKDMNKTEKQIRHNIFATLSLSSKLDSFAFIAFVLIYVIFNVIYFSKF